MRGKGLSARRRIALCRITPACAGKSGFKRRIGLGVQDHPRVCGEKLTATFMPTCISGSPPRVRGKGLVVKKVTPRAGITPACAGKSCISINLLVAIEDHPRVCGEKRPPVLSHELHTGSPPRVRGKEGEGKCRKNLSRITPACAGKRTHPRRSTAIGWDHPRVCGEK